MASAWILGEYEGVRTDINRHDPSMLNIINCDSLFPPAFEPGLKDGKISRTRETSKPVIRSEIYGSPTGTETVLPREEGRAPG